MQTSEKRSAAARMVLTSSTRNSEIRQLSSPVWTATSRPVPFTQNRWFLPSRPIRKNLRSPLPSTLPFRWLKRAPLTWNRASSTEEKVPRSLSQLFISSVRGIFFGRFRAIRGAAVEIHLNSVAGAPERDGHGVTLAGDTKNLPIRTMSRSRTVTENSRRELAKDSERSSTWFNSTLSNSVSPAA